MNSNKILCLSKQTNALSNFCSKFKVQYKVHKSQEYLIYAIA